jgi:hypothetical protein
MFWMMTAAGAASSALLSLTCHFGYGRRNWGEYGLCRKQTLLNRTAASMNVPNAVSLNASPYATGDIET